MRWGGGLIIIAALAGASFLILRHALKPFDQPFDDLTDWDWLVEPAFGPSTPKVHPGGGLTVHPLDPEQSRLGAHVMRSIAAKDGPAGFSSFHQRGDRL